MKPFLIALVVAWVAIAPGVAHADETYQLRVDGLACPFCAYGIEKKLNAVNGMKAIKVHINRGLVVVTVADGTPFDRQRAEKIVKDAGFTLRGFRRVTGGG